MGQHSMMTGIPDVKPVLSCSSVNIIQNLIQSNGVQLGQMVTAGLNTHKTNWETAELCRSSCSHQAHSFRLALLDCDREQPKSSWMLTLSLLACTVGLVVSMIKITSDHSRGGCKSNTLTTYSAQWKSHVPIDLWGGQGPKTFVITFRANIIMWLPN